MNTNWKAVLLGEHSEIILGGTPKTKEPSYWDGNIPWASIIDFNVIKKIYSTEKTITEKGLNESNTKLLRVGDIIISARGTVGKTVVCGVPMAFNQSCYALRSKSDELNQDFLYYLINYYVIQLQKKATGGVFDTIVTDTLRNLEIKIPELTLQVKIATILSAYDDLIENNRRRINILEEMAQMIYREWFVNFRFPGHKNVRMTESQLGMIPAGWNEAKLEAICSKVTDGTHESVQPVEDGFHMVSAKDIINSFIDFSKTHYISAADHEKIMNRSRPEKGDILFSKIGTLGSTAIVNEDFEFSIKNIALFKPSMEHQSNYLFLHFTDMDTLQKLAQMASGTSQKFFSLDFLRNYKLVYPPEGILLKFDHIITPMIRQRYLINRINGILRQTRDLLLPKLISGELDVSELDITIPEANP